MRTLKLTLAYDGTRFVGWQRQAQGESIQGWIEDALSRIEGQPVVVHGAGRTDAGVHALGQVASAAVTFTLRPDTLRRALNARLPADIRVLAVADAGADFHARFSRHVKTYRYRLSTGEVASPFTRGMVWHLTEALDAGAMASAAQALVGTHDFAAFQSAGTPTTSTVRTIFRSDVALASRFDPSGSDDLGVESTPSSQDLRYEVSGDGFLRYMVRAIVGTLVEIGRGRRAVSEVAALLAGGRRSEAGPTAPPQGLVLVGVDYD